MPMRPLPDGVRVLVKIGNTEVEKIAVNRDDETGAIQVLRITVAEVPKSGHLDWPQAAPFDEFPKGQWRLKPPTPTDEGKGPADHSAGQGV